MTTRRDFLSCLVAAPLLTVATIAPRAGADAGPGWRQAPPVPEFLDLGDILMLAGAPTSGLLAVITVDADGRVTLQLPRAEVGQGIVTVGAQLVAEELELPVQRVAVELAPARPELLFNQMTGSSNSVRSLYDPVRWSAATVRARLLAAAGARLGIGAGELRTAEGFVAAADGRRLSYGELSRAAADPALAAVVAAPKPRSRHRIIGRPQRRPDARAIVTGRHEYTMDLRIPDALPVVVARPPTIRGTVLAVDLAAIRAMPGVIDAALIETGVAICARTFGDAIAARHAARVAWNPGPVDGESDDTIRATLRKTIAPFVIPRLQDIAPGASTVELDFDFGFVPHAPLESNCAVADVRADRAEVWAPMQTPIVAAHTIAGHLGLPPNAVRATVVPAGGSFGRRLFFDAPLEAVQASRALRRPVRLMWTRVDDMRHGRARPASHHRVRANIAGGRVVGYEHRVAAVETDFRHGLGECLTAMVAQVPMIGNLSFAETVFLTSVVCPYDLGVVTYGLTEAPVRMHTGSWRSVYSANTRVCEEIAVDEIARLLGQDRLAYRKRTAKSDRARRVLAEVERMSGWGRELGPGVALGVSLHTEHRSVIACVVELDATGEAPRVTKAYFAVDVGLAVNPLGLEAQIMSGLTDAISTVLTAGLHIERGLPLEGSYSHFHFARMRDTPRVFEVSILDSGDRPGGAGELAVPVAAGAVATALIQATGQPVHRFPAKSEIDFEPFPR
ncbi:xanthine dehydrogenase family protein molybdopterin-binding subunit [Nocardia sp. IFM 10818]